MSIEICNLRKTKPSQPYDFKVDRSSPIGNPFEMRSEMERDSVCDKYELHFNNKNHTVAFTLYLNGLCEAYKKYGKLRLFCWCSPKRCHAETIKK